MIDMSMTSERGNEGVYVNMAQQINYWYGQLQGELDSLDTRAKYLKDFEQVLSNVMPKPLLTYDNYRQYHDNPEFKLPSNPLAFVSYDLFRSWMTCYSELMRLVGVVGKTQMEIVGLGEPL